MFVLVNAQQFRIWGLLPTIDDLLVVCQRRAYCAQIIAKTLDIDKVDKVDKEGLAAEREQGLGQDEELPKKRDDCGNVPTIKGG